MQQLRDLLTDNNIIEKFGMQIVSFNIIESVGCIFRLCVTSMVSPSGSLMKDGFVEVILECKVLELTI